MALTQSDDARTRRVAGVPAAAFLGLWPLTLPLLLTAGVIWLTFQSGGYFAGETAIAVIVLGPVLVLWMMLSPRPFDALNAALIVAVSSLALFAGWALLSQAWSDAPARAVLESNRTLLYLLAVVLFGLAARLPLVCNNIVRCVTAGLVAVSICGLITRLLPEVWPIADTFEFERLSYPISYWNAQGMLAALGLVAALHLASSGDERRAIRALAAAAIPILGSALLLTFSRGAIGAAIIGLVVYVPLARPARITSALGALVPSTATALIVTYQASAVSNASGPNAEMITRGESVALVIAVCAVAAAALLWLLAPLDAVVDRAQRRFPSLRWGLIAIVVLIAAAGMAAANIPGHVADTVDSLGQVRQPVSDGGDLRAHLTSISDSGRADQYRVAWRGFEQNPVVGSGAGTYPMLWARHRTTLQNVNDGHSLYLETMAEMGLVGLALLLAAIGSLIVGCLLRRRTGRGIGSVAFVLVLMWALRAGIDWDWELPAVTLPVLALAAVAIYTPPRNAPLEPCRSWPNSLPRLLIGIVLLAALITPVAIARSQSHLNAAVNDMRQGRCGPAIGSALAANDALSIRPEPFLVLAICDLQAREGELAMNAFNAAIRRDPDNWRLIYDRAIARAALGQDPRPGIRAALRRNPRSGFLKEARTRFDTASAREWRRRAGQSSLLE